VWRFTPLFRKPKQQSRRLIEVVTNQILRDIFMTCPCGMGGSWMLIFSNSRFYLCQGCLLKFSSHLDVGGYTIMNINSKEVLWCLGPKPK